MRGSHGEAEPPAGSRGRAQRDPGAEPLLRGQGRSPLKLKALKHLRTYKESPKFADNIPSPSWQWQLGNRHSRHEFGPLWAEPQAGSRGTAPGHGSRIRGLCCPETERFEVFAHLKKARKFAFIMPRPSKCGNGSWQTDATVTDWPTPVPFFAWPHSYILHMAITSEIYCEVLVR